LIRFDNEKGFMKESKSPASTKLESAGPPLVVREREHEFLD
jgi:hypothetical protein